MKYTIKDFFESKERLAIKITTLEDLKKICKAFDRAGIMYSDKSKYTDKLDLFNDKFEKYGNIGLSNVYCLDSYGYCKIDWYFKEGYTIINMNDIDFEETMTVAEYVDSLNRLNLKKACIECYELKNDRKCGHVCANCEFKKVVNLANYLKSTYTPKQEITLTEFDKQFILNLDEKYKWIAVLSPGKINLFKEKPKKVGNTWAYDGYSVWIAKVYKEDLLQFIKWEDKEPWSIEMLKEIANESF